MDDEPIIRMDLHELLDEKGYEVCGEAADGFDAIDICRRTSPDVVLMDIKMPLLDGLSAVKIMREEGIETTVVLLTAYCEREFIDKAKELGVSGYLLKPIDEKALAPTIEVAVARSSETRKLKRDMSKVSERLENRTIIEKAKGIVMHNNELTEQNAYDYIRKLGQAKNLSMRRIAEIIIIQDRSCPDGTDKRSL